ncbi:MAG: hypothetical protein ACI93L_002122, partial [Cyclobacteriaceae bacterium]
CLNLLFDVGLPFLVKKKWSITGLRIKLNGDLGFIGSMSLLPN